MSGSVTTDGLPTAWVRCRLSDCCQVVRGVSFPSNVKSLEPRSGFVGCLRTANVQREVDWSDLWYVPEKVVRRQEQFVRPLDILISTANSAELVGKVCLIRNVDHPTTLGAFISLLRPIEVDSKFLYFEMSTDQVQQSLRFRASTTTNISNISTGKLIETQLALPPLAEQRRIVAKIEELFADLDAGVAALERVRANLKRYRAAVLKAAVEGRLTAGWRSAHPDAEPASELLSRILAERRAKWEADQQAKFAAAGRAPPKNWQAKYVEPSPPDTTDLPPLPAGWFWATVEQLGVVQLGRQRSPKNRSDKHPTKYIRAANITEDGLALDDLLDMDFTPVEQASYRLRPGDIVLSEASGSPDQVGKPAVWNDEIENCCFQNTVIRHRPDSIPSEFLLVVYKHHYFNKVFAQVAGGVGINHLSAAKFSRLVIPLPPLAEQTVIFGDVEERLSMASSAERQLAADLARAARLRQSILKRAFAGKLVPQDPNDEPAEKLLERVRSRQSIDNGTGDDSSTVRTRRSRTRTQR